MTRPRQRKRLRGFLQAFTTSSGLRLRFRVKARSLKQRNAGSAGSSEGPHPGPAPPAEGVAKDGPRSLFVEFTGPDTPVLTARNGELLNALEHIATKMLRLEPEEHDRSRSTPTNSRPTATARCVCPPRRHRARASHRTSSCLPADDLARAAHAAHAAPAESGLPRLQRRRAGRFWCSTQRRRHLRAFNLSATGERSLPPRRHDANPGAQTPSARY